MEREKTIRNVIVFGAHPDDCEYYCGGTAAKFAAAGHRVKFVSLTNGDAGHHRLKGEELITRRRAEAEEAARRLGITATEVLDHHDGQLQPTLEAREQVIHRIREWEADIVLTHRPNDYHPDHRATSKLVQDSAYLVKVPNICPGTPVLRTNPVYLYMEDGFRKPEPFEPAIAVAIDDVWLLKVEALDAHASQMYEWLPWCDWSEEPAPVLREDRLQWLAKKVGQEISEATGACLKGRYGTQWAATIQRAESFELCEYGHQAEPAELDKLFPR